MTPHEQNLTKAKLFLENAAEELSLVEKIMGLGYKRAAISRAYYAAFYAASAILVLDGLEFSKHSAVISAVGRNYIGIKGITKQHQKNLVDLFEERGKSDYEVMPISRTPDPQPYFKNAKEWVGIATRIVSEFTQRKDNHK